MFGRYLQDSRVRSHVNSRQNIISLDIYPLGLSMQVQDHPGIDSGLSRKEIPYLFGSPCFGCKVLFQLFAV